MNAPIPRERATFPEGDMVLDALRIGAQRALRIHKALGNSIVTFEDGKIVTVPAEEIQIDDAPAPVQFRG